MINNINTDNMLRVGTVLHGTYRIDRYLSSGGFGNTYVATNIQFGEQYAIKEFFMRGISQRDDNNTTVSVSNTDNRETFASQLEKFKKEARRLRKLNNEHIVHVYDFFEENGTAYYVMDYIDGENLSERLKRTNTPLSEKEALDILDQVLDALDTAHKQGILHLDLKPANIMVDNKGVVKLIDFGASKQLSSKGMATTSTAISYTNGYAPREQMEQNLNKFGPWTDFYALGATLYYLLTHKNPPMPSDIDDDISSDKHLSLSMPNNISRKTRRLVLRFMDTNWRNRPQSVNDIHKFLIAVDANGSKEDSQNTIIACIHNDLEEEGCVERHNPKRIVLIIGIIVTIILLIAFIVGNTRHHKIYNKTNNIFLKSDTDTNKIKKDTLNLVKSDSAKSNNYIGTDIVKIIQVYLNSTSKGKFTPPFDVFFDNGALKEDNTDNYSANEMDDGGEFSYRKSYRARLTLGGKGVYGNFHNVWNICLKGAHAGAMVLDFSEEGGDDNLKAKDKISSALHGKIIKKIERKDIDYYLYLYKIKDGYMFVRYLIGGGAVWLYIRVSPYKELVYEVYNECAKSIQDSDNTGSSSDEL